MTSHGGTAGRRRSRLLGDGLVLLAGDLHNHSLHSDGDGDPERAFALMRSAGLDVAALTDHASIPYSHVERLGQESYPHAQALATARRPPRSLDLAEWERAGELARAADVPGEFTALRGFEWTEPWLGHANVWFSDDVHGVLTPGRVDGLHEWLAETAPDALFGYNHPGREPGRLGDFALTAGLVPRMVALELFNRFDDYLFQGRSLGQDSPLVDCLDAGWRPGLIGCSDEHGRSYGLRGKGRTGIWVREHSRDGVREALLARRTFATREHGLALEATLDGAPMGSTVPSVGSTGGQMRLRVAVEVAAPAVGPTVQLQILGSGRPVPSVLHLAEARLGEVTEVELDVAPGTGWLVLRVADRRRAAGGEAPGDHPGFAYGLAYASPWYLG